MADPEGRSALAKVILLLRELPGILKQLVGFTFARFPRRPREVLARGALNRERLRARRQGFATGLGLRDFPSADSVA